MRRFILFFTAWALAGTVGAEPSTRVAWTPDLLRFVKAGDPAKGKELAGVCGGCHNDVSTNPNLEGQLPTYLYRQLLDYKQGSRKDPSTAMNGVAGTLSEKDFADLAAYYSQLEPVRGIGGADDPTDIVARGDGRRMEPPCSSCHGAGGQGEAVDTPRLAGQKTAYLEQVLLAYKSGERHNDVYGRMRLIAGKLSDREIKQLAEYYGKLK
ncbi:cytochrome c [Methylococcus sp. EFPC2]|uniref:c-type cytochrome n=1 Tax=Methylococcus sp. EFPC2 TaxID=2812648 RepID=UPI0019672BC6|nr:c-type cytochrome [Methylococcus sp. EFPC2]QSA96466.1 c-type cytochrome [Methylococcus sp. EFPC2]